MCMKSRGERRQGQETNRETPEGQISQCDTPAHVSEIFDDHKTSENLHISYAYAYFCHCVNNEVEFHSFPERFLFNAITHAMMNIYPNGGLIPSTE